MRKIIWIALIIFACTPAKQENQNPVSAPVETEVTMPSLTDSQKAEGWKLLFDGKSLNGWQVFKGGKNSTWEAKNGILRCKPANEKVAGDGNPLADLMTSDEFKDFELSFDWKISTDGNSGVMFRVTEELDQPFFSGPEYQLLDDKGFPDQDATHMTGAVFGLYAPASKILKPVGQWNSSRLLVNKNHVEHWLNGQKVVEYELLSPDWNKRKNASSWKDAKDYGRLPKGHIDFQDRGSEVWFRNVMIKSL